MKRINDPCVRLRSVIESVVLLVLIAALRLPVIAVEPHPFLDREDHWLAFDTRAFDLSTTVGLELVHGTIEKHPNNPLMPADKPWEEGLNNLYPNIDYDREGKKFKLWYKCILEDKTLIDRMQPPRTTHGVGWYLLYATSPDGLTWKKPLFEQHQFTGAGPTNAVARDTPNVGVFRDTNPDAPADRRYKMVFDRGPGQVLVRFSPDGVHWAEPIAVDIPGFRVGDTHNNAFWDQRLGKYVLITRYYVGERTVARAESEDFITWERSKMILRPTLEEGRTHQLYCMPTFRYGNTFIGLIMNYHLGVDRSVDCELAWSPDSRQWHRLLPGQAFIPLGPEGSYDSRCIYAQANPPLIGRDGRLMLFYGGDDAPHRGWVRHCLPCLATFRRDGFAGLKPSSDHRNSKAFGTIMTQPLVVDAELAVTADIATDGSIRASVVGEDSESFEGFSAEEFTPIKTTVTDGVLRWGNRTTASLAGKIIRLKFEIAGDATLFSMTGLTDPGRPSISPPSRPFSNSLTVTLAAPSGKPGVVHFTTDGSGPGSDSPTAENGSVTLDSSVTLKARFFPAGKSAGSAMVSAKYNLRVPWQGARIPVRHVENFDKPPTGWKAADRVVHVASGGADGSGYVRAERRASLNPYLSSYPESSDGVFAGDLEDRYGGIGVELSYLQRTAGARQPSRIELFAEDLANWSYWKLPKATKEWTRVSVRIRYDWTDEEAIAAGWEPAPDAFSWRETVANVGRVVYAPIIVQLDTDPWSYDIDDVTFETIFAEPSN